MTSLDGRLPDIFKVVTLLDISYTYINLTLNCIMNYNFGQLTSQCISFNVTKCDCSTNACVNSPLPCLGINLTPVPPTDTPTEPPSSPTGTDPSPVAPPPKIPDQAFFAPSNLKTSIPIVAGAVAAAILLFGCIIPFIVWKLTRRHRHLQRKTVPEELRPFFKKSGTGWVKASSNVWLKEVLPKTEEFARFSFCEKMMRGDNVFSYNRIYSVYNETLSLTFLTYRKTLGTRHLNDPNTFVKSDWKNRSDMELRNWTVTCFNDYVKQFPWNQGLPEGDLPVIVACHGTDLDIAKKICETGFAALSTLDSGFYGKGVYFSFYIPYIFPYVSSTKSPVMIISLIVPGNTYPVTEQPSGKGSLRGKHIKTGYQSHYVKTYANGLPCNSSDAKNHYDELVLDQEAQMCPVYLVALENHNFNLLATKWNREVVKRDKVKEEVVVNDDSVNPPPPPPPTEEPLRTDPIYIEFEEKNV